jgi:hypothetical protein
MRALAVVGIVLMALCIALSLSMQRLQAQARAAKAADYSRQWERLRKRVQEMLEGCQGGTVVLVTRCASHWKRAGLTAWK